jgi:acyl-CoA ligase (AMP-forming) (exosortase A-associated)
VQDLDPTPFPLDHLAVCGVAGCTALQTRDEMIDFSALDQMVGRLAAALRALGLADGDRIATWLNKTVEACLLPLAAARAGLVYVPINPALKRAQVAHILLDSGARLLIAGEGRLAALETGDIPNACSVMAEAAAKAARFDGPGLEKSAHNPHSLCAILYTSGSTGKPKGVMLSHANLWLGAVSVAAYLGLNANDRTLCVLPLSFDYGQNQLLSTWKAGGCAVPLDYLNARDVARAVEACGITTLAGVPPLWVQLLETPWSAQVASSLNRITNSGGALTPRLVKALQAQFPKADIFAMYGLTEAFRSTYLPPNLLKTNPTSIGSAIPFAEIMVVKPDGSEAGAGEVGELVHAGPLVAQGYWQDEERSALRFKAAPPWSYYGGMAVWSGDTVCRDTQGLLTFVGRDDEMIKTSGNRLSPAEIEEVAVESGLTSEAVALGVPDEKIGHAIILAVRGSSDSEARLRAHLRQELPAFMQPKEILWLEALPRNANGKFDRNAIKRQVLSQEATQ